MNDDNTLTTEQVDSEAIMLAEAMRELAANAGYTNLHVTMCEERDGVPATIAVNMGHVGNSYEVNLLKVGKNGCWIDFNKLKRSYRFGDTE